MHEYSIVAGLLEQAERHVTQHGAISVTRVEVRIGDSSGVDADLFQSAFEVLSRDSLCRGATLSIRRVPTLWQCGSCGGELRAGDVLICKGCGAPGRLVAGDELILDRLELEA
jgi:hydrogenase nickel incorporation protein HypA/HybF